MSAATQPNANSASRLLAGYRPLPGVADELVDAAGNVRPVWQPFIDYLSKMKPEELARRIDQGDQYPVSYPHLTLPTNREVRIRAVAVAFKKKTFHQNESVE